MNNPEAFNTKEFPVWKGYNITSEALNSVKELWLDNKDEMIKTIYKNILEINYYRSMLFYIQTKLHSNESLHLCLDSSKEVFDIMITPCEILEDEEFDRKYHSYQYPTSKCPICNSYYEDVGTEVFKGKFRLDVCGNCGYTFNVEM